MFLNLVEESMFIIPLLNNCYSLFLDGSMISLTMNDPLLAIFKTRNGEWGNGAMG